MFLQEVKKKLSLQTDIINIKMLKDLPVPDLLKNNIKAAKRIIDLLNDNKKMLLVGDYDTDGIVATTIVYSFLVETGYSNLVEFLIPSRLKDGYGLSENVINYATSLNYDFIVTVDNGISANKAIDLANKNGLEVIITDHHTAGKVLPNASIIVNPRVAGETFPYTFISGATVAWYLIAAIKKELGVNLDINKYLDLVAITILSDVMPMDNINLPLLKYGLSLIKDQKRYIYKLLWNDWTAPTIDETAISFTLVPMINAIGRINNANTAVNMFLATDKKEISEYVSEMNKINEERKSLTRDFLENANNYINSNILLTDQNVIIVRNEVFHEGIVGIIAGKLAEKYSLPTYVFSYNHEKKIWKGSGRSTGNVHLYDLTAKVDYLLEGFGGHKGAVGLALKEENWDSFVSALIIETSKIERKVLTENNKLVFDCSLPDIDFNLIEILKYHAPYGNGNPKPIFRTVVNVVIEKELKGGLHFKCRCIQDNKEMVGLFFNVNKNEFLEIIKNPLIIEFNPSVSYDLKNNLFNLEIIISKFEKFN